MENTYKISGASGFLGKNLIRYLADQGITAEPITRLELRQISAANLIGSEAVLHLAGKAHDLKNADNPEEYMAVNFELTKKIYDAFLQSEATKFIFISSVKAAADQVTGVLSEDTIPDPQTSYGKSKLMAEAYIEAQPLPSGKSFYILRPCMIHGPGNKGNLNLLYQFVKRGIPYPFAAYDNRRSFLSVDNLCFVITELLQQAPIPSGIYHVADDDTLSTNEVVAILSASIGKKQKLWFLPKSFIGMVAKIGDQLKLPLNTERLNKLTESYKVSNSKIKHALHITMPLKAREGLLLTAKSFHTKNSQ